MATCRHCGRPIVQHPAGTWIPRDGTLDENPAGIYCQTLANRRPEMLHEPMPSGLEGAPQWTSPDTARTRAAADDSTDSPQHSAADDRSGTTASARRKSGRTPPERQNIQMRIRRALVLPAHSKPRRSDGRR